LKEKIVELAWWQEYALDENLTLAATPAQHFSGRGLTDRNRTLWASWAILGPNHRVFFSGDSGYFDGFKQIGRKYGPFDTTFIECGAYNENWSGIHMFPEQTVQAHRDLEGKILQPIHWATFNLSLHPWYEPMERLIAAARSGRVTTSTPIMGRIVDYTTFQSHDYWWRPAMARSLRAASPQLATTGR
jgi:L-ascorbate metabolism protein UlaG (beta-lactamase superfamily)